MKQDLASHISRMSLMIFLFKLASARKGRYKGYSEVEEELFTVEYHSYQEISCELYLLKLCKTAVMEVCNIVFNRDKNVCEKVRMFIIVQERKVCVLTCWCTFECIARIDRTVSTAVLLFTSFSFFLKLTTYYL